MDKHLVTIALVTSLALTACSTALRQVPGAGETGPGTRAMPVPFGTPVALTDTAFGETWSWSLQVLEVIRGDAANAIVAQAGPYYNDKPEAGTSWMLIKLRVTLDAGGVFTFSSHDVDVLASGQLFSGHRYDVCCIEELGYPWLDASLADPGTSVEGWAVLPVATDESAPLLVLNVDEHRTDLEDGVYLALTP